MESAQEAPDDAAKLVLFERFLAFQQACWALSTLAFSDELSLRDAHLPWAAACALVISTPFVGPRWRALRAGASLCLVVSSWPLTSNHGLFGTLLSVMLPLLVHEPKTALRFFQHALLVVCFGAGVQKLLHGTWWRGSFLAYEVVHASRFELAMRWLLSDEAWERLRMLRGDAVGTGPYVLSGPPLWLARALVMLEVGLPLAALRPRLRTGAHLGLVLLAVAFALVARELLFGGLFVALNALVWPKAAMRNTFIVVVAIYAIGALLWFATEGRAWG